MFVFRILMEFLSERAFFSVGENVNSLAFFFLFLFFYVEIFPINSWFILFDYVFF